MKTLLTRCCVWMMAGLLLAACSTSTPEPTPTPLPTDTPAPTSTNIPVPTATAVPSQTPLPTRTPPPTLYPTSTRRPTSTPGPTATPTRPKPLAPTRTAAPTKAPVPPLFSVVQQTQQRMYNLGGAMDRLYQGAGSEACAPFLADFYAVTNAPTFDVSAQPSNVQTAYALYRDGIAIIADRVNSIRLVCEAGGGYVNPLDFDIARTAVNDAGGRLGEALNLLQTP